MIFLRPWYLLFLIILPVVLFYIKRHQNIFSAWAKIINNAELLNFLTIKGQSKSSRIGWSLLLIGLFFLIIAISGPSFEKRDVANFKEQNAVMIALDLSSDTSTEDLDKFKFEIRDILSETKDLNVGLIVYTDEPFLITPISEDKKLIENLLPQVNHSIMPKNGNNLDKANLYANQKLKDAGFDNGQVVVLSNNKKTDVGAIINKINAQNTSIKESQNKSEEWVDCGYYFLFVPALICLWFFRRGLFVVLLLFSFNANASWFLNANQQGYKDFSQGDYKKAANEFKDKDWRASSLYKGGDYKKAVDLFSDEYNQGNALAKGGDIQGAITKYESVLEKTPNHEDAQFNLEYLKKQQQNNQQNNQENEQNQQDSSEDKNQDNEQSQNQNQNNEQSQDKNQDNEQGQSQSQDNEQNQDQENASEGDKQEQSAQESAEQKDNPEGQEQEGYDEKSQAREQQFREIPEDVGGLLRAFIKKEYMQRHRGER